MFAKLFNTKEHGQILVFKTKAEDDAPQIKITFESDGITVSYAPTYANSEEGEKTRDHYFDAFTEEMAINNITNLKTKFFNQDK